MSYPNIFNKQTIMKLETRLSGIVRKQRTKNTRSHAEQKAYLESKRRRSIAPTLFWMNL